MYHIEKAGLIYCHMVNIPGCGDGGWTQVLKMDGTKVKLILFLLLLTILCTILLKVNCETKFFFIIGGFLWTMTLFCNCSSNSRVNTSRQSCSFIQQLPKLFCFDRMVGESIPWLPKLHVTVLKRQTRYLLLSEGRTVVKSICECNQSGRMVIFYPEPVAMSTTFCGWL